MSDRDDALRSDRASDEMRPPQSSIRRLAADAWCGRMLRVVLCLLVALAAGCGERAGPRGVGTGDKMEVFVSIAPQAFLVERIGGAHVIVHQFVESGADPHTFQPTPRQIMALGRSRFYFSIGIPFEDRIIEKVRESHVGVEVADMARGIKRRQMAYDRRDHAEAHDVEDEGHDHKGGDPHLWLSPPLLKVLARNTADALAAADPANASDYRRHLDQLLEEIDETHRRIADLLAPYKGRTFYVFHPAFGYFGDAYGLRQEAVEIEGKSPAPRQLEELIRHSRAEEVKIIFVQPQFDQRSAEAVAGGIGGAVVPMDPLAKDVLANFHGMAAKLQQALGG